MELFRARREQDNAFSVRDPEPPESLQDVWAPAAQMATVGIFILLLGVCLLFARPLLLPVAAALVIGTTLAPLVKAAARHRISPWVTALVLGAVLLAAAGGAVTLLASPLAEWIARAPEIGATIKQKLYVLDRPLAAVRELQEVLLPSGNTV
ncbi:MAG: hypothetical protein JOZ35_04855, partial [Hyphomicrobiales bacterium]|nr:hypothetical protein [Hyphomicrobiales bacterium]